MPRLKDLFWYVLGLPKTLIFNLRYFPLRTALRLPVLLSHRVWFRRLGGTVRLEGPIRTGIVRIGFSDVGLFGPNERGTILELSGVLVFQGMANIGHGSRLIVSGELVLGPRFVVAASASIVCAHGIRFGSDCLISWDTMFTDTDFHRIADDSGQTLNPDTEIVIGSRVWVGCRSTILKGSRIGDGCVVGAGAVVAGSFEAPRQVLAGNPAGAIRQGVSWTA